MSTPHLEYELQDGFIHNWLVLGPLETSVEVSADDDLAEPTRKLVIAQDRYSQDPGIQGDPVERKTIAIDDQELRWAYTRCLDDHFVDLSTFHHTWTYLRAWAYTKLDLFDAAEVTFVLTTNGPADVWINGQHVHRQEHFHHQDPKSVAFVASLVEGENELLVRFEEVAARECPYVMALRLQGLDDAADAADVEVRVPSATERTVRHVLLEEVLQQSALETETAFKGRQVNLH